mmetsp:Transcript_32925/g.78125  ORF Transcript_32925/g.78125 Transcript_32925/m.78125 type:complete len:214 (+) Transcript_32925:812-1453(+)
MARRLRRRRRRPTRTSSSCSTQPTSLNQLCQGAPQSPPPGSAASRRPRRPRRRCRKRRCSAPGARPYPGRGRSSSRCSLRAPRSRRPRPARWARPPLPRQLARWSGSTRRPTTAMRAHGTTPRLRRSAPLLARGACKTTATRGAALGWRRTCTVTRPRPLRTSRWTALLRTPRTPARMPCERAKAGCRRCSSRRWGRCWRQGALPGGSTTPTL